MLPRLYLMKPAFCSVPATKDTLLRRTPSICARNSWVRDRKSTRLNSSHANISYAVFCLKKKKKKMGVTCCLLRVYVIRACVCVVVERMCVVVQCLWNSSFVTLLCQLSRAVELVAVSYAL